MHRLIIFLLWALMLKPEVYAESSTSLMDMAKKELPSCAYDCLIKAFVNAATSDSLTPSCQADTNCLMYADTFTNNMTACVHLTCTIRESLTTQNVTETLKGNPIRDHTHVISHAAVIGGIIALFAFVLRVMARIPFFGGVWGWDDWAMVVTMLPTVPLTILAVPLANYGLGRDIWTVPFEHITKVLYIYYFDESLYLAAIPLTKISMLLFYLRIFPNKKFKRCVYFMLALCIGYILSFVPAVIWQCTPIHVAWSNWDHEHEGGHCISLNMEGWVSGGLNIAFDVVIITMPLPLLWKLNLKWRKKVGILLMIVGGSFVTFISCLRLGWMVQFANSSNMTWDYTPVGYWSTIEVHTGIIFACLPAMRSLYLRIFPAKPSTSYYPYNSKSAGAFPSSAKPSNRPDINQKGFKPLNEEYQLEEGISTQKRGENLRTGVVETKIQCGSTRSRNDTPPPPLASRPAYARGDGSDRGIKVKSDITVTVVKSASGSPASSLERLDRQIGGWKPEGSMRHGGQTFGS